ncbi:MAG TPA: site-specific integrase [Fimbriimonadaceae bacterium]|nr:site-specific integrase [Fimbriimonadaceae bacterium]
MPTYAVFTRYWFDTYAIANNKPSEQKNKETNLRLHLLPVFGHLKLGQITTELIERFKASQLARGLSAKTINTQLCTLRTSLSCASDWGILEKLPRIKWLKVPPQRFDFLNPGESARLLDASFESWGGASARFAMVLCALRTGMRIGEIVALRWDDVDFARGYLTVRRSIVLGVESSPKNNRIRHIPLAPDFAVVLRQRFSERQSDFVFGEAQSSGRHATRMLDTACRRAGLRHIGWHSLRHTFASHLAAEGVPLNYVQALLGHSTIQMTMRYAHLMPSTLKSAIEALLVAEKRGREELGQLIGTGVVPALAQT